MKICKQIVNNFEKKKGKKRNYTDYEKPKLFKKKSIFFDLRVLAVFIGKPWTWCHVHWKNVYDNIYDILSHQLGKTKYGINVWKKSMRNDH